MKKILLVLACIMIPLFIFAFNYNTVFLALTVITPTVLSLILLVLAVAFYFLPSILSYIRKHNNSSAIFLVNLLLGWTLIGWLYTYIWSLKKS